MEEGIIDKSKATRREVLARRIASNITHCMYSVEGIPPKQYSKVGYGPVSLAPRIKKGQRVEKVLTKQNGAVDAYA